MLIQNVDRQDWPGYEPTESQEQAAYVRSEITRLAGCLEHLNPSLPRIAEQGVDDLRYLSFLIQRLQDVLDDWREYWDEEYLNEVEAE